MAQPTQARTKTKAEQEARQKAARRAEQANILAGVRPVLEQDEQLLSFARARVAGGWRGKLNVGPEAFLAPFTNVALTERRFLVQHVHHANGKPSEMLPHSYALGMIARVTFTDIETYGGEPACRLTLHLENDLYVRLRLRGQLNFNSAKNMAELFDTLTITRRRSPVSPSQSVCANCSQILDHSYKFCPYCATQQPQTASNAGPSSVHTGLTLATEEDRQGEAETIDNLQSEVPQETDFAYERADQPAEFGTALPLPDMTLPQDEEPAPEETQALDMSAVNGLTTGLDTRDASVETTLETEESPETFLDASLFTPGAAEAPTPGEAEKAEGKRGSGGEEESQFAIDNPQSVEFGQYEAQEFVELPFSVTPDATADFTFESASDARPNGTFDVAANADEAGQSANAETLLALAEADEPSSAAEAPSPAATEATITVTEAAFTAEKARPADEPESESDPAEPAPPSDNTPSGDHQP